MMRRTQVTMAGVALVMGGTALFGGAAGVSAANGDTRAIVSSSTNVSGVTIDKRAGYLPGLWVCLPQQPGYVEVIDFVVGESRTGSEPPPGTPNSPALSATGPTPGSFRNSPA